MSTLFFGDCLDVMREHMADDSVDLIYLDPPYNSKRIYNASMGGAQWIAFKDTWQWSEAVDDFHELAGDVEMASTMEGLRVILGEGDSLAYLSYMGNRLRECKRVLKPTGTIYLHCDPKMSHYLKLVMDSIFGLKNFRNEIIWCYRGGGVPKKDFARKHDVIFRYSLTDKVVFNVDAVRIPYSVDVLSSHPSRYDKSYRANKVYEGYKPNEAGKHPEDWWEIQPVMPSSSDRLYPTQKPLLLLQRIVKASSNEGDIVFDPFCGCGTTVHAAQRLNRQWIGIDICVKACQVIKERLEGSFEGIWSDVDYIGLPVTLDQANVLAEIDKFKFEKWAASLAPGIEANKLQVADKGIDGYGRIAIGKGKFIDLVSQVKGGSTGPSHVQAFNGARQQAGAELGIFTCFADRVTTKMREAAASTGRYDGKWPVVQIYTVDDYFAGRQPKLPISFG